MSREILGNNLMEVLSSLNVKAQIMYKGRSYEVWELDDTQFDILCNIPEEDWEGYDSWWRYSEGAVITPCEDVIINGIRVLGYENYKEKSWIDEMREKEPNENWRYDMQEYYSLTNHLSDTCGTSTEKNVAALAVEMAKWNGMKLSELFERLEGGEYE